MDTTKSDLLLSTYVNGFDDVFPGHASSPAWEVVRQIPEVVSKAIGSLSPDYIVNGTIAVHKDAIVEEHVVMKGPLIISANAFIGAHAYIRGGCYVGLQARVGPGCELKSTLLFPRSALAHFNFAGDSIIGSDVNLEAGAIIANHYNERTNKEIELTINGQSFRTGVEKFGAVVGDRSRIGANAVLSPGTILAPHTVVCRLELVDQAK